MIPSVPFLSATPSTPLEELSSMFFNSKRFVLYFVSGSNYDSTEPQIRLPFFPYRIADPGVK
jgi:hypothetical protein